MCANGGIGRLSVKGGILAACLSLALFSPELLKRFFAYDLVFFRVYHVLWLLTVLILAKRFIPRLNEKVTIGKIYERNFQQAGEESEAKQKKLREYTRKMDSGAIRSAVYWTALVLTIGLWRLAGLLDGMWIFVIVLFFVFMDQFCITVWCPFKAIIQHKCCNTCRINNWGYLMAFSPMVYVPSFWTYSILLLSVAAIVQWEYLFRKHPERFYELYNAKLMCKNCVKKCGKRK